VPVLLLLSLLLVVSSPPAPTVESVVRAFEARYRHASTLAATFLESYSENGRVVRANAGTSYFRRPGKMRWEYESPDKNLFLVDGKFAWFYVPVDHTATRVPAKQSADWRTPLALLAGEAKLSKVCSALAFAKSASPEKSENVVLFCALHGSEDKREPTALPSSRDTVAFLEVNPATGELSRVLVNQPGGVRLEFRFGNWQFNPPLPESLFHFAPAPGTAIVNGELPSGESSANP
jgi:outer membrane lipoprotein carrier protein